MVAVLAAHGGGPLLNAAGLDGTAAPASSTTGMLGGALGVLLAALLLARTASGLLGPHFDIGVKPVDPLTRSFGRTLPAIGILVVLLVPAALLLGWLGASAGAAVSLDSLLPALIGAARCSVWWFSASKYSSWSGAAASRIEPQLVAAMLAALPALLLGAFGVGDWTLITQFLLLGLVAIIPV